MRALVIGGTGPTGPFILQGLLDRGYDVTMYHRGLHEIADSPQVSAHLHGDPNDPEALGRDLGGHWDVVLSMYGRLRYIADEFAGRCDRFIGIGGIAGYVSPEDLPYPQGRAMPWSEAHPRYRERAPGTEINWAVAETERGVWVHHARGDFAATMFRYTNLYGPRVPRQWLWPIVRRILEGRPHIVVPGDGSTLQPICYAENAALQVLLALDREEAIGQAFHTVDRATYPIRDVIRIAADALGRSIDVVGVSHPLAERLATGYVRYNRLLDSAKLAYVLGYADHVDPAEGIARTAQWLAEHRDELDEAELAGLVPNPYAYDAEDRLVASFRAWQRETAEQIPAPSVRQARGPQFRGRSPAAGG